MSIHRAVVHFIALTLLLFAAGCNGEDHPTDTGPAATGTLRLSLTDAPTPIEGVEAMHLTVSAVRVNAAADSDSSHGTWYEILPDTLTVEERTSDLLHYANGESIVLGEELLPVGHYEQIRLVLEKATVTVHGTVYDLKVPSGETSGLKLIRGFDILSNGMTALTLDFDVGRSLHATPPQSTNFKLKPVIRIVSDLLKGGVIGSVLPTGIDAMVMAVSTELGDTATALVDPLTGDYAIGALRPSTYDLTALAPGYADSMVTDVEVFSGLDVGPIDFTLTAAADELSQ